MQKKMPTGTHIVLLIPGDIELQSQFDGGQLLQRVSGTPQSPEPGSKELAGEDAVCVGSEETQANQGEGITGSKNRNWESGVFWGLCRVTAVASSERRSHSHPDQFIVYSRHLQQTSTTHRMD